MMKIRISRSYNECNQLVSMSQAFLVNYVTGWRHIIKVKVDRWLSEVFFPETILCQETILEFLYLYAPRFCILFVIGENDDATICVFSRGCCEVNGTVVRAVSGGPPHSRKYYFLSIVKTNIPLRFKENMINFYFYYINCWLTWSNSEKHWKTPIELCACAKNNCSI